MDARYEHYKDFSSRQMSPEDRKKVWLEISDMTEEAFDQMMANNKVRQSRVPDVGTSAADFRIERLDKGRKRTGEFLTLSELRGKPVGLIFGSYT
jgi:hypothetical protein